MLVSLGCGADSSEDDGRLRIAWTSDPVRVDPAHAVDVVGGSAVGLLFEGLVTFDRDGSVSPGLARSWEILGDGALYRFDLDPEARASDGSAIGAEAVRASFRRLLSPETASPRSWVLEKILGAAAFRDGDAEDVEGLRVISPHELEIELESPSAAFLGLLAMPNAAVVPPGAPLDGRVATGPWVLVEHVRDSHLVFRPNEHWHGASPAFSAIHVRILPEEFTRVAEFEVGNLDLLEIPASASRRFREDPRPAREIVRQVALVTEYIGLNNDDPVLSDVRVRRALNLAVNVDEILEHVLEGRGVRSGGAVPPSLLGGAEPASYPHDPEEAGRLLREVSLPPEWELELWQRPGPLAAQVLEAVQADLRRAGIESRIRIRDWSALKASIDRGETPAFFINWYADYPDAENFLVPLFHSSNVGGGGNRARFRDAEIDGLLESLDREPDATRRAEIAQIADRRIHEAAPWIYLWHPVLEIAVGAGVKGYRPHPIPSCERWLDVVPAGERAGAAS